MDYKKLVEDLKSHGLRNGSSLGYHFGLCDAAADAITYLIARVEKAEKALDAAVRELDEVTAAVDDMADLIDDNVHPVVDYSLYLTLRENSDAISTWRYESEWRGKIEG